MILDDKELKRAIEPYLGKSLKKVADEAEINQGNFHVAWHKVSFSKNMKIKLNQWLSQQK